MVAANATIEPFSTIQPFSINVTTGALTALPSFGDLTGKGNFGPQPPLAVSPDGEFLYAVLGETSVQAFGLNPDGTFNGTEFNTADDSLTATGTITSLSATKSADGKEVVIVTTANPTANVQALLNSSSTLTNVGRSVLGGGHQQHRLRCHRGHIR